MSIVPLLASLAGEFDNYQLMNELDHWDDDFGFGIHPTEIFRPRIHATAYMHPRRRLMPYERSMMARRAAAAARHGKGGEMTGHNALMPQITKDGFQVHMDVSQFKPNELTVKTVDKTVVVEGKHEEREDDHGMIQRHFVRKYTLPKDYDPKDVISTISTDGVLTVKAPPPPNKSQKQNERIVQIQQTGPAHLSVKAPEQDGDAKKAGKNQNGANEKMETGK